MFMDLSRSMLLLSLGVLLLGVSCALHAEEDAAAIAKQVESYPLTTCVISGGKLGSMGEAVNHLHEGHLVRFCCKGCIKTFKANPAKYLKVIDEAAAKAKGADDNAAAKVEAGTSTGKASGGCGGGGCGN